MARHTAGPVLLAGAAGQAGVRPGRRPRDAPRAWQGPPGRRLLTPIRSSPECLVSAGTRREASPGGTREGETQGDESNGGEDGSWRRAEATGDEGQTESLTGDPECARGRGLHLPCR